MFIFGRFVTIFFHFGPNAIKLHKIIGKFNVMGKVNGSRPRLIWQPIIFPRPNPGQVRRLEQDATLRLQSGG